MARYTTKYMFRYDSTLIVDELVWQVANDKL